VTAWRKSSYSGPSNSCVELAAANAVAARLLDLRVFVRDSKDPDGPVIALRAGQWRALLDRVKAGRHDH
jgi:hypothetical protein